MIRFLLICLMLSWSCVHQAVEKLIIIIIPSYNNIKFYEKNLDSIRKQAYSNYRVLYVDDCSTDGTAQAVEEYVKCWNLENKILLIKNRIRRGAMYNHYVATNCCPNNAIILTLDGDDWLSESPMVLAYINEVYQDQNIWMTYGQFQEYPSGQKGFCSNMPDIIKRLHAYRDYNWVTSHVRTYYAGLFKAIPVGYFIRNDSFLKSTSDLAIMFALLELSGGRVLFIDDILYMYNTTNENSDFRTRVLEQLSNNYWVRSRTPLVAFADRSWEDERKLDTSCVYNIHFSVHSAQACHDYLTTTSYTDIQKSNIQVWYKTSGQEEETAYQTLGKQQGISIRSIDPHADFKMQILACIQALPIDTYVIITTDDHCWHSSWSCVECVKMLVSTKAVSYTCARGTDACMDSIFVSPENTPVFIPITDSFCVWKYSEASGHWRAPYCVDGLVIKASELQLIFGIVKGATLEQLFYNVSLLSSRNLDDVGLCNFTAPCKRLIDNDDL